MSENIFEKHQLGQDIEQILGFLNNCSIYVAWIAASLANEGSGLHPPVLEAYKIGSSPLHINNAYLEDFVIPKIKWMRENSSNFLPELQQFANQVKIVACAYTLKLITTSDTTTIIAIGRDQANPLEESKILNVHNAHEQYHSIDQRRNESIYLKYFKAFLEKTSFHYDSLENGFHYWKFVSPQSKVLSLLTPSETKKQQLASRANSMINPNFLNLVNKIWQTEQKFIFSTGDESDAHRPFSNFYNAMDHDERNRDAELFGRQQGSISWDILKTIRGFNENNTNKRQDLEEQESESPKRRRKAGQSTHIRYLLQTASEEKRRAGEFPRAETQKTVGNNPIEKPVIGRAFSYSTPSNDFFGYVITQTWLNQDTGIIDQAIGQPARNTPNGGYIILSDQESEMVKIMIIDETWRLYGDEYGQFKIYWGQLQNAVASKKVLQLELEPLQRSLKDKEKNDAFEEVTNLNDSQFEGLVNTLMEKCSDKAVQQMINDGELPQLAGWDLVGFESQIAKEKRGKKHGYEDQRIVLAKYFFDVPVAIQETTSEEVIEEWITKLYRNIQKKKRRSDKFNGKSKKGKVEYRLTQFVREK